MKTVLHALNTGLHHAFATDTRVHLLGEDVLDPYGGAFKVTRGLATAYPDRVHTSPISEAGIVGIAAGMALRGLRPVVEIMFGDFTTLIADQVVNHIAKFRYMYNEQVCVPLVIRTPMGGRRGYGATHSQTLEKMFLGVPGLRVLAPTALGDPGSLLAHAILHDDEPVLFIENKLLYLSKLHTAASLPDFNLTPAGIKPAPTPPGPRSHSVPAPFTGAPPPSHSSLTPDTLQPDTPTYTLTLRAAPPPTLTIAAYGYMAELAREAAHTLAYEHEIFTEIVVPTQLAPVDAAPVLASVQRTRKLLTVEEGTLTLGWGAEIVARVAEQLGSGLHAARRVAAQPTPIPAAGPLETAALPGVADIVAAARTLQ